MKIEDFDKFQQGITGVYAFYDKEINDFALDLWWNALKHFDLNAVIQAFGRHVVNPEAGKWLPKPADIIRMLQGSTQDAALAAWAKVDKAVRHKGPYVDVVFDDPLIHRVLHDMGGWIQLGEKNEDEWPFVAKEFENRYRGFRERSDIPEYPSVLVGIANAYNSSKGLEMQPCIMIGDKTECEKVMSKGGSGAMIEFHQVAHSIKDSKLLNKPLAQNQQNVE